MFVSKNKDMEGRLVRVLTGKGFCNYALSML